MLYNIMRLEVGVIFLYEGGDLHFPQKRPNNENKLRIFKVGQGFEHIQQMLEGCFASYTDERLGLAPGVRSHARAPACHGDDDL